MNRSRTLGAIVTATTIMVGSLAHTEIARADGPSEMETCANAAEEAQNARKEGKLTVARDKLLVCARPACPAFVKNDCTKWLVEVEGSLPSVVVRAVDAKGKDVAAVSVSVDGKVVTTTLDGRPIVVDPGEHTFTYRAEGGAPVSENVIIRQGEVNRILSVTLGAPAAVAPTAPPPPSASEGGGKIPTATWVVGGAGLVALGIGTVFWAVGSSAHSTLASGCAKTASCSQADVDSAKSKLLIGDVTFSLGVVAIGAAVVIALVTKEPAPAPTPAAARHFDMRAVNGGAVASFGAQF